ncbi:MAG: transposase [Faecousia sp.]
MNHQTSDAESGIITDVFVTPGNVNDCTPHTNRLETQIDKFGFETEAVCADAGYDNSEVYDAMLKRGIRTYIPTKRKPNNTPSYTEGFEPETFTYDPKEDSLSKSGVFAAKNPNNYTAGFSCTPFSRWGAFFKASEFVSEDMHLRFCLQYHPRSILLRCGCGGTICSRAKAV